MSKVNIPWEDRPEGNNDIVWRYSQNPVIGRYHIPSSNSIFNSAVVSFEDGFAGVFRCDNKAVQMNIHVGFSKDGLDWDINNNPIKMKNGNSDMIHSNINMIHESYSLKTVIGSHGATDTTAQQLALHIHMILNLFISVKMPFFLSIGMVCYFQKKWMGNT